MIRRLTIVLVASLFVASIFAGGAYAAVNKAKPDKVYYNTYSPVSDASMPAAASRYTPYMGGTRYDANCFYIASEVGTVIEHSQIGNTWYDMQKNGSMGRMISVSSGGWKNVSWHYTNAVFPGAQLYIKCNCAPTGLGGWVGGVSGYNADGGPPSNRNPGYVNQTNLPDGTSIVVYHRTTGTPIWYTTIAADDEPCLGIFTRMWDVPDWIQNSPTANPMEWPKGVVQHDPVTGRDYIHVVGTEGNTASGAPVMIAYERCYIKPGSAISNDTMKCQTYRDGATQTDNRLPGQNGAGAFFRITHFDSSCGITPVIAVSPVSKKVAIGFFKPNNPNGACDRWSDCCYIESTDLGNDWINGTNWPPAHVNITNFPELGNERCANDLSVCYDYEDYLHIVYVTGQYDPSDGSLYFRSRLYHWSQAKGTSMIASQTDDGAAPGAHNLNIAKMSISAPDPIYHGGPGLDSVYLFCSWTQFDSSDKSFAGWGNGDLMGCGSRDSGATWGEVYNLTNTNTPDCAPGNCLSEHWSSMAFNMYQGDLHLEYICDKDAGGAIQDAGTAWMSNPVMYLRLTQWPLDPKPRIEYRLDTPPEWTLPPLKVNPYQTRTLIFKVYSVGNAAVTYSINSTNPCISCNVPPTVLAPRDSDAVAVVLQGSGFCKNKFISSYITLVSNEPSLDDIDIQFVSDSAYYECPRDPVTYDTLENGVLRMYVNANTQEWIEDIGTYSGDDTVHQVFFQGGAFVAVTQNSDTLVGRYMGANDQHALAREYLHLNSMYGDYNLEYSWNVVIHDLNPPVDDKWWWWEILHENVFFKSTASANLKHCVIKFITIERHNAPGWWPTHPTFSGYEDTYIGQMMDIDAPWDSLGSQNGRNWAGYDATNNIAWQKGWQWPGNPHPEYDNYYVGMALIAGNQAGESTTPYGTNNVRNDSTVYKVSPWGWTDGLFYRLAKNNVLGTIQDPDSLVDRSQIVTARKIVAASPFAPIDRASFTVVKAIAPGGLADLQAKVAAARAWVASKPNILCGDVSNDGYIGVGDIVTLISYLFKHSPEPIGPKMRADVNNSGMINIADIIVLVDYLYKGGLQPHCQGVW